MLLVHAADIHLGRRRLDGRLPDEDLARAFAYVAAQAVERKADLFLLAGDLFDRAQVEPGNLRQAQEVLRTLKAAGIPVVAIEGNHDKESIGFTGETWLRFLAKEDLLILLQTRFSSEGAHWDQWDPATRTGSWIDIGGVRITGAGYLGAATPGKLRQLTAVMGPHPANILMLHAGPEYFVGEGGGFTKQDLDEVRAKVRYLALGHIHRPMLHGNWGCNPGSPEHCDLREASFPTPRGFAVVRIDPSSSGDPVITICDTPKRPTLRVPLDCTPFGNKLKHGLEHLLEEAVKLVRGQNPALECAVELDLTGKANLNRLALDLSWLAGEIERATGVAAVQVIATGLNAGIDGVQDGGGAPRISRGALERRAITDELEERGLFPELADLQQAGELFHELKELVAAGAEPEIVAQRLLTSTLVTLPKP